MFKRLKNIIYIFINTCILYLKILFLYIKSYLNFKLFVNNFSINFIFYKLLYRFYNNFSFISFLILISYLILELIILHFFKYVKLLKILIKKNINLLINISFYIIQLKKIYILLKNFQIEYQSKNFIDFCKNSILKKQKQTIFYYIYFFFISIFFVVLKKKQLLKLLNNGLIYLRYYKIFSKYFYIHQLAYNYTNFQFYSNYNITIRRFIYTLLIDLIEYFSFIFYSNVLQQTFQHYLKCSKFFIKIFVKKVWFIFMFLIFYIYMLFNIIFNYNLFIRTPLDSNLGKYQFTETRVSWIILPFFKAIQFFIRPFLRYISTFHLMQLNFKVLNYFLFIYVLKDCLLLIKFIFKIIYKIFNIFYIFVKNSLNFINNFIKKIKVRLFIDASVWAFKSSIFFFILFYYQLFLFIFQISKIKLNFKFNLIIFVKFCLKILIIGFAFLVYNLILLFFLFVFLLESLFIFKIIFVILLFYYFYKYYIIYNIICQYYILSSYFLFYNYRTISYFTRNFSYYCLKKYIKKYHFSKYYYNYFINNFKYDETNMFFFKSLKKIEIVNINLLEKRYKLLNSILIPTANANLEEKFLFKNRFNVTYNNIKNKKIKIQIKELNQLFVLDVFTLVHYFLKDNDKNRFHFYYCQLHYIYVKNYKLITRNKCNKYFKLNLTYFEFNYENFEFFFNDINSDFSINYMYFIIFLNLNYYKKMRS